MCIHIVDVWCYCYLFYERPYRRWIFFPDGFSWNFDNLLIFAQDLPQNIIKNYNTDNMKHSSIIIYDFDVKNQIRTAGNLNQGLLQGSIFWCPSGKLKSMHRDCPKKKHTITLQFCVHIVDVWRLFLKFWNFTSFWTGFTQKHHN